MFDVVIDDIDLIEPPFANFADSEETADLCGGKISAQAAMGGQFSCRPLISGTLKSRTMFDGEFSAHTCNGEK